MGRLSTRRLRGHLLDAGALTARVARASAAAIPASSIPAFDCAFGRQSTALQIVDTMPKCKSTKPPSVLARAPERTKFKARTSVRPDRSGKMPLRPSSMSMAPYARAIAPTGPPPPRLWVQATFRLARLNFVPALRLDGEDECESGEQGAGDGARESRRVQWPGRNR